jgi:hypothetical protein
VVIIAKNKELLLNIFCGPFSADTIQNSAVGNFSPKTERNKDKSS